MAANPGQVWRRLGLAPIKPGTDQAWVRRQIRRSRAIKNVSARITWLALVFIPLILLGILPGCSGEDQRVSPILKVGGIPDQDASRLARRYESFSDYLSDRLGVEVEYVPTVDYPAVVTAFSQDGLDLAFFGGLTGVQARLRRPGSQVIAQREQDARFHTKFIAGARVPIESLPIDSLAGLKSLASDLTLTFGSEISTSGHLMPRHFMGQAGIDPDKDFRSLPNYSGSHDLTWKLVESGSFDVGVLNENVWDRAVDQGRVDLERVRVFYTTPEYFDYNWTVNPNVEVRFGQGFTGRLQDALLSLNDGEHGDILDLFSARRFIPSQNDNYAEIEAVARSLGIIR